MTSTLNVIRAVILWVYQKSVAFCLVFPTVFGSVQCLVGLKLTKSRITIVIIDNYYYYYRKSYTKYNKLQV